MTSDPNRTLRYASAPKDHLAGQEAHIYGLTIVPGGGQPPMASGSLILKDDRIVALGETHALMASHPKATIVDGRGFWVMPGLVNAHTHVAMGFFRGLGHGRDHMIESFFFPAERSLTADLIEPLSYSYIYAGLTAGVTTFGDHYYWIEGVGRAADRLGVRAVIGETVADLGGAFPGRDSWNRMQKLLEAWPFSARITPAICPHAADTVSRPLLRELAQFAQKNRLPLHLHLSQTEGERSRVLGREGLSPVLYADECGALTPSTLAVHLITADDSDIRCLKASGASVGLSPASQILYEQLAPIERFMAAGLPLAIGTDCAASNDDADLLGELRLLALLAKDRGAPPLSFESDEILKIGTIHGAKALGLGDDIGIIAPGRKADLVFLREDVGTLPAARPAINLIYTMGRRHVEHVMVDGRWVLWKRRLTTAREKDLRVAYLNAVKEIHRRLAPH